MKTQLLIPLLAVACSGCLLSSPKLPACWNVEAKDTSPIATRSACAEQGAAVTRLAFVQVRSPFDSSNFLVLLDDGTVACDPCNSFPAPPSALLRGPTIDIMRACPYFGQILSSSSVGKNSQTVEVEVSRLMLDCREGRREAVVELFVTLFRNREAAKTVRGQCRYDASVDDYSIAFSTAYTRALREALAQF